MKIVDLCTLFGFASVRVFCVCQCELHEIRLQYHSGLPSAISMMKKKNTVAAERRINCCLRTKKKTGSHSALIITRTFMYILYTISTALNFDGYTFLLLIIILFLIPILSCLSRVLTGSWLGHCVCVYYCLDRSFGRCYCCEPRKLLHHKQNRRTKNWITCGHRRRGCVNNTAHWYIYICAVSTRCCCIQARRKGSDRDSESNGVGRNERERRSQISALPVQHTGKRWPGDVAPFGI